MTSIYLFIDKIEFDAYTTQEKNEVVNASVHSDMNDIPLEQVSGTDKYIIEAREVCAIAVKNCSDKKWYTSKEMLIEKRA